MKPNCIELPDCEPIPILYEDRSVLAVDKPRGWMFLPVSCQTVSRNGDCQNHGIRIQALPTYTF